jgi:peptide chain release factor 2
LQIKNLILFGVIFDSGSLKKQLVNLKAQSEVEGFWSDNEKARKVMVEISEIEQNIDLISDFENKIKEVNDYFLLASEENDQAIVSECHETLNKIINDLEKLEFQLQFDGEADSSSCYLEIHAGAGGTESQDWAQMLQRMYMRWAERKKFKFEIMYESYGEEAGIKSCTALVEGKYAFGYLKKESGIHRLVRISPFDSNARRHTSFSSVWISPYVDETVEINLQDKDMRIDTFRASGAGGQHVNTTDSAIRITHEPTGIVVQCQNERSQHKNKSTAINLLKSKLYELEIQKIENEKKASEDKKSDIGWGNQIRSYVLHPYRMVKDLRSNHEDSDPDAVLDGEIDDLIFSNIK